MPYHPYRAFTAKQERVIDGIRRDLSNKEIAAELGCSPTTVQGHIDRIVNLLRNPDHLSDRAAIFQFAWWRVWSELGAKEARMWKEEERALVEAQREERRRAREPEGV